MEKLEKLLERFKSLGLKETKTKELFILLIKNRFSKEIEKKDLEIKDKKILVKISGPLKSEIILNKGFFIDKIKEELDLEILDIN